MFHSAVLRGGELGEMPLNVIGAIATAGLIRSENVSAGIATYRSPTTTLLIPFHRVPPPERNRRKVVRRVVVRDRTQPRLLGSTPSMKHQVTAIS